MVLRNGEVVARQAGAAPANVLRDWLDQALAAQTGLTKDSPQEAST
jgi:thioredoxin 2